MFSNGIRALALTAASIGAVHTLSGPDHYLPLIAMAKARRWSLARTIFVTLLAGTGHIASSVAIGFIGVLLGVAVHRLELVENWRADAAAWALIAFGLVYFAWGIRGALHGRHHHHPHSRDRTALWSILAIFAFGSCEPLIPILMYPASRRSMAGLVLVTAVYAAATMTAMLAGVIVGMYGAGAVRIPGLDRWAHALAGGTMAACGLAIVFLGL